MTAPEKPTKRAAEALPRMSRRYIASLALSAAVVLVVGVLVRRWLHDTARTAPAPPSQAAAFQQLSQEGQLRRTAAYVAQRVAAAATFVEYLPAVGASGVRWAPDTVLTTDSTHVVRVLTGASAARAIDGDSSAHSVSMAPDSIRRDWVLVVGRSAAGGVMSATVLAGGRAPAECNGRPVESYVLGVPLDERLAGAGLFNMAGEAIGLAVWCGAHVLPIPATEVRRLVRAHPSAPVTAPPFGLGVRGDSLARAYVRADSALLVDFVGRGSPADAADLRVGDALVAIDGQPATLEVARTTLDGMAAESLVVTRRRAGRDERVTLVAARNATSRVGQGFGITVEQGAPRGLEMTEVRAGSVAARAGLRSGDRLVRIDATVITSASLAERLLGEAAAASGATLVVFDRDDGEHGALLGDGDSEREAPR